MTTKMSSFFASPPKVSSEFVKHFLNYPANRDTNEDNNPTSLAGVIKMVVTVAFNKNAAMWSETVGLRTRST